MNYKIIAAILFIFLSFTSDGFAQAVSDTPVAGSKTPLDESLSTVGHDQGRIDAWRNIQLVQGPTLALVFLVALLLIFVPPWRRGERMNALHFKAYTLTLIIFAGLFLIVTGWSDNQLAPMMGLLGTLAGYILGERTGTRLPTDTDGKVRGRQSSSSTEA